MGQDISGFGLRVILTCDLTFPQGLVITQFGDDADPLDSPSLALAEGAMGLNGDAIFWSKPNLIPMVIAVVPNSDDDINLGILADANRVAKNKLAIKDIIDAQIIYADGTSVSKTGGAIVAAIFGFPIASSGRMKTKVYGFMFENIG